MTPRARRSLAAVAAVTSALALAACSGDPAGPKPAETATAPASTVPADPVLAGLVGPGCAGYVEQVPTGPGSVPGMANATLAAAAARNPLLTRLSRALSGKLNPKVTLVDTLNGGEYTVFAPVDAAFAKLPVTTVTNLKADRLELVKLLTYHLIAGQLSPAQLSGRQKTVEGDDVTVTGSGDTLAVNGVPVICGGIRTANATVYLIDSVLTPPR